MNKLQLAFLRLTRLGTTASMTLSLKRSVVLSNQIALAGFPMVSIYILINIFIRPQPILIGAGLTMVAIFGCLLLANALGAHVIGRLTLVLMYPVLVLATAWISKAADPEFVSLTPYFGDRIYLLLGSTFPILLFEKREEKSLYWLGISISLLGMIIYHPILVLADLDISRLGLDLGNGYIVSLMSYSIVMVIIMFSLDFLKGVNKKYEEELFMTNEMLKFNRKTIFNQNVELFEQKQEIKDQVEAIKSYNQQIQNQKLKLNSSIMAALSIQKAIIPTRQKLHQHLGEHLVVFLPKDLVSGDFYWVAQRDGNVVLFLGDCTGHGVPGAFMTLIFKTMLDELVEHEGVTSPSRLLEKLDQRVFHNLHQHNPLYDGGMEGAVVVWRLGSKTITYAGAKTPLYEVCANGQVISHEPTRRMVGGVGKRAQPFVEQAIGLKADSRYFLATDGLPDLVSVTGKRLNSRKVKELLAQTAHLSFADQGRHIEGHIKQYKKGAIQRDDLALIGFNPIGQAQNKSSGV